MDRVEKDTLVCTQCGIEKEMTEYSYIKSKSRFPSRCKKCSNKSGRSWYKQNKKHVAKVKREGKLLREYGITTAIFENMKKDQNNRCKICGINFTGISKFDTCVDHNHQTNEVRGILCRHCNTGLGCFMDNTSTLLLAIEYLEEYNE